jgi:IS5 family transposase
MNRFCSYLWVVVLILVDKTRAAIEPIIGHLKSDFRLSRNLLKGQVGDEINVLMAACAWNLKKWLVIATIFLFFRN